MGKISRVCKFYYSNICLEHQQKYILLLISLKVCNLQPAIILYRTHNSENIFTVYYES
jgi:hypothetical protein